MKKIVLTGAAGRLGHELRAPLAAMADSLVSTDIADSLQSDTLSNETFVKIDLGDLSAVEPLLKDADMVVHFGAIPDESSWENILHSNIKGAYNIWEAAKRAGVRRIVYASSIHAVGMHEKWERITADTSHRPDSYYGLAKCFTEDLARMYWDKCGVEAVCLRIYSCTEKPMNARALGSWLSYGDLVQLVQRCVETPTVGFTVLYGVSNNDRSPIDNSGAHFLGYQPRDNAEDYAEALLAAEPQHDPQDKAQTRHGGPFATGELGQGAAAGLVKKK